jgi:hypothetical protein
MITIKSVTTQVSAGVNTSSINLTTPAAAVGDLLLIIFGNDWDILSNMTLTSINPSATATEITNFRADGGTNSAHMKAWYAPVTTAGAVTVTTDDVYNAGDEKFLAVFILSGADTTSPVDGSANGGALTSSTTPTTPSVSPSGTVSLLFGVVQTDGINNGFGAVFTPPIGMSLQYNITDGAFARMAGITQQLSASGATGAKAFESDKSVSWVAASVAIKSAAAAPIVTTNAVTSITPTSAQGNGSVDSDNGDTVTERGFVWSTSANPTTSDSKVTASGTTGSYNGSLTGLSDSTTYHVRAYAINANGTAYGADVTFINSGASLSWLKS